MRIRLIILLFLILTACSPRLIPAPDPTQIIALTPVPTIDFSKISANVTLYPVETPSELATSVGFPTEVPQVLDPHTEELIMKAKNDLNQQTGINIDGIKVLSVESINWPDGSLGCGKPGTEYIQVITPGFRIMLEAGNQTYNYHTDMSNQVILCSEKVPIRISPTP